MTRPADQKWILNEEARTIACRNTDRALKRWIENWNLANPDDLILCMPGRVEERSLRNALHKMALKHTPGVQQRKALSGRSLVRGKFIKKGATNHGNR